MEFIQSLVDLINPKHKAVAKPPVRKYDYDLDHPMIKELREGDIILYRFRGEKDFPGGVISYMTSSPYSHVETHTFDGYDVSASTNGVTFVDLYKSHIVDGENRVDVMRLKGGLSREQRLIIFSKLAQSLLKPYDYANLVGFPYLKGEAALRKAGNDAYICSELTAWAYNNAGLDLIKATPESIESPSDVARSDLLDYVGTFEKGVKLEGNFRNEFHGEEYSRFSEFIAKFMGLLTKRDEYYKGLYLNKALLEGEIK